jgi:hypothetical protein
MSEVPARRLGAMWRYGVGVVGLAVLGIATFRSWEGGDGGALVALIAAGALLLISPVVVDRLTNFSFGVDGIAVGFVAEVAQIAPQAAGILGRSELATLAEAYAVVREELTGEEHRDVRVAMQDLLVRRAASLSQRHKFDGGEVGELFAKGAPVVRVLALGLMKGDPSLADAETVRAAISDPTTANEQFHGLSLAQIRWNAFNKPERQAIHAVIDGLTLRSGSDRENLARKVRSLQVT